MLQNKQGSAGALDEVRVLDFTTVMAGPFGARLFADLGADVLKVESLSGDQVRARPPLRGDHSSYFGNLNAGKKSISVNLKSKEIVELVKSAIGQFDVLIENFRPGVMERFGLGAEELCQLNPRLIYCSISGYGQTGPKAMSPAYAPIIHAASGFDEAFLGYQDGVDKPSNCGIFIADVLSGVYAFGAVQAALYQREKTGKGQCIDVSMLDSMIGMLVYEVQEAQFPVTTRRPLYKPVKTRDGFIIVAPTSPRNFEDLCEAAKHPEWMEDPRFATQESRNANWDELYSVIGDWAANMQSREAEMVLSERGVPCARYAPIAEVLNDPQLAARGSLAEVSDGAGAFKVPNPPFTMSESQTAARNYVPNLGQENDCFFQDELGLSVESVKRLRENRCIL